MSRASLWLAPVLLFPTEVMAAALQCVEAQVGGPAVLGVQIENVQSDDDALNLLRVTAGNGAFLHIYFDEASEVEARRHSSCLGTQLNLLAQELLDDRQGVQWASVVFTADIQYIPPRGAEIKTRWVIFTDPDAPEAQQPRRMVIQTLPHEQVHDFQSRNGAITPLWFAEGHATWAGLRITGMLDTETARLEREERLSELRAADEPVNLAGWGQRRVKREAILRQVSSADRARMESDSKFVPKGGSYTFTMDDFESDETMAGARYAAAMMMFEGLEQRHGAEKVRRWVFDVTSTSNVVSQDQLAASVKIHFGEDLSELLKH
jgi:hypothetical protein